MINRILDRLARLFVGTPAPLPRNVSEDAALDPHERQLRDDYGVRPDVPKPPKTPAVWGAAVASMLALSACGPTATEAAIRDLHRIGDECSANAARIAETAPSRAEGIRLLDAERARCLAAACAYCDRYAIDCAAHGAICEVTP